MVAHSLNCLSTSICFTAPKPWTLWSIHPVQADTAWLGIELRDVEKREVRWCWLNLHTNACEMLEGLPWWGTPLAANAQALVWQHYETPKLPEARGISVWFKGESAARWSLPEATAKEIVENTVQVRFREQDLCLSLEGGEAQKEAAENVSAKPSLQPPHAFLPEHANFEALCRLVSQIAPTAKWPVAIEVAEVKDAYALACFFCTENIFSQKLWLLNAAGEVAWEGTLVQEAKGLQLGNFFWLNGQLFFTKAGKTLYVIQQKNTA